MFFVNEVIEMTKIILSQEINFMIHFFVKHSFIFTFGGRKQQSRRGDRIKMTYYLSRQSNRISHSFIFPNYLPAGKIITRVEVINRKAQQGKGTYMNTKRRQELGCQKLYLTETET